jgi:hypothetical protein
METFVATVRGSVSVLSLGLGLAACSPVEFSYMWANGHSHVQPGTGEAPRCKELESYSFTVKEAHAFEGFVVEKDKYIDGLLCDGSWIVKPEWQDLRTGGHTYAYARKPGKPTLTHIDLATGKRTETDFTKIGQVLATRSQTFTAGEDVGMVADDYDRAVKVSLLGKDGLPTVTFEHLPLDLPRGMPVMDALGDAYVVRHVDAKGQRVDIVYNKQGIPISPELPPLGRFFGPTANGRVVDAVPTSPDRKLFWPLSSDGTVPPKPEALLGVKPVRDGEAGVIGWAVLWQTARGPRYGFAAPALANILASKNFAIWEEVENSEIQVSPSVVVRAEGKTEFVALAYPELTPRVKRTFASAAEGVNYLQRVHDAKVNAETQEGRDRYEAYLQAQKAAEAERARAAAAAQQRHAANEAEAYAAIAKKDFARAGSLVEDADVQTIGRVVGKILGARGGDAVSTGLLTTAVLYVSPDQANQIRALLAARQQKAYEDTARAAANNAAPVGPNFGPSGTAAWEKGPGTTNVAAQGQWSSVYNYLSGKQNWYFGSGYQVKK